MSMTCAPLLDGEESGDYENSWSDETAGHSRRIVISYKRKYVHKVLVNCLFKLAQEKVWLDELTVPQ